MANRTWKDTALAVPGVGVSMFAQGDLSSLLACVRSRGFVARSRVPGLHNVFVAGDSCVLGSRCRRARDSNLTASWLEAILARRDRLERRADRKVLARLREDHLRGSWVARHRVCVECHPAPGGYLLLPSSRRRLNE